MAQIDVVVPARNAAETLGACLAGLERAGFVPEQVIVVDDGSTDGTSGIARAAGVRAIRSDSPAGAAQARNIGAAATDASLLLFVDADVVLHSGGRDRILAFFAAHPGHAAIIGSYDDVPPAPGRLSRIRNLLHHHVHQGAGGDVASFWTGCGAIRRADFEASGGFEPGHPLEDVALGLELARAGRPVRLDPALLGTHLKRWTLRSMLRADLFQRALPWSRMLLGPARGTAPAALNAGRAGQVSVLLSGLAALACIAAIFISAMWIATILALAALCAQNVGFLGLVRRNLGTFAALQAVFVLWVHFLCAGTGFGLALLERIRPSEAAETKGPPSRRNV